VGLASSECSSECSGSGIAPSCCIRPSRSSSTQCYLLTYVVILAVAINSVLLVAQPNLRLFREYDNIWAEVLYWPAILLTMCVITILTFR
jgi:hypothetical protein